MMAASAATVPADDDICGMLRKSVQDFCARHSGVARTRKLRDIEPGFDPGVWQQMAEAGWTGMPLPEATGGLGLGLAEICVVAEELAADLAPEPFGPATVAALAIAGGDNAGLKQRLLPAIIAGELIASLAWQESANALDALHPKTRLTDAGGRLVLTGEKHFVPGAAGAGGFAVTAATADGTALVWVEAGSGGLSREATPAVDGSMLSTLRFDGVEVADANIVASQATTLLPRLLDEAAVIATAELLGIIRAAFERTREYLGQRMQFGRPIGSFQVLQHRMADMLLATEQARSMAQLAASRLADATREERRRIVSAAKVKVSEAARFVGQEAVQLHGGIGVTDELPASHYFRRLTMIEVAFGDVDHHLGALGALLFD